MRIDSEEVSARDKRVVGIRMDLIGSAGEHGLWWVAEAFNDGSTKPEGMYTDRVQARALADELAAQWHVPVQVSELA